MAANATVAMMTWDWKTHEAKEITSVKTQLTPVFDEALVALTIPEDAINGTSSSSSSSSSLVSCVSIEIGG